MTDQPSPASPAAPGAPTPALTWATIVAGGGIDRWIDAEIQRLGLADSRDPGALSEADKKLFKARRDEERRVRGKLKKDARAAYARAHLVHLGAGVHIRDGADSDTFDVADMDARRTFNGLVDIRDASALATLLELDVPALRWLAFHREVDRGTHYHRWLIPKRTGGTRLISAPKPRLKRAQRWIMENISERLPCSSAAHGFIAGRSIATNAAPHAGAKVVVKLDLKDFYPTITLPRVKGLFRKAGYPEQVATVLALLCTECPREELVVHGQPHFVATGARSLPQGAPTSPSLTNAICLRFDARLTGLAKALGFTYTRYADDLTFSASSAKGARRPPVARLQRAVRDIAAAEGFTVHPDKTRVMRAGRRQQVTGLVVNALASGGDADAPARPPARVPRKTVRELRAAIKNRELGREGKGESLAQLRGMAAFVYMVDPARGREFLARLDRLEGSSRGGQA